MKWAIGVAAALLVIACKNDQDSRMVPSSSADYIQISSTGDIAAKLAEFRTMLGEQLNSTVDQTAGRREINWDAVPENLTNVNSFPGDFFNSTDPKVADGRKRGAIFSTTGNGFRVSDNNFRDILADYANQFKAFSPIRTFAPVGSNQLEVTFRVPGTDRPATVKGFGVVFSDVDQANSTTIQYFEGEKSLGTFKVPARTDPKGFSLLGVRFPNNKVTRAVIRSGNAPISNGFWDGTDYDIVAMDDFLYDEPVEIH